MPEPKSMRELPSTSSITPPPARTAKTGRTLPTPLATVAVLRASSSCDFGPGIAVTTRRSWGREGPPDSSVMRCSREERGFYPQARGAAGDRACSVGEQSACRLVRDGHSRRGTDRPRARYAVGRNGPGPAGRRRGWAGRTRMPRWGSARVRGGARGACPRGAWWGARVRWPRCPAVLRSRHTPPPGTNGARRRYRPGAVPDDGPRRCGRAPGPASARGHDADGGPRARGAAAQRQHRAVR